MPYTDLMLDPLADLFMSGMDPRRMQPAAQVAALRNQPMPRQMVGAPTPDFSNVQTGAPSFDNVQTGPRAAQTARGASALPRATGSQPAPAAAPPEAAAGPDPLMTQFADLQRRQVEAMGDVERAYQPVDRSGAEEMYRKQSRQGGQGLLMALAAQEAGKEFAPVGAHFLKQAAEAQAPLKMAGGTMTQSGFIEDPGYNQNLAVQRADAKLRQIDTALQQNITSQERRRLLLEQERIKDEQQAAMLEGRREIAGLTTSIAAGNRADARNDKRVDTIRKEYNAKLAKVEAGAGFAEAVTTALADPGLGRNAPAQVALIMQFGKMLDPDSVVREAEQRMIAGARGIADSLMQAIPRIQSGVLLTPQQLQQMRAVAEQYRAGSSQRVNDVKQQYTELARRNNLPPEDIVLGSGGASMPAGAVRPKGAPQAAPAATPAGPPPGAVRPK